MRILSLSAFENKKYTAYDRFHGNGPYGEIPTKKEPIRTLGFTLPYNNGIYFPIFRKARPSFFRVLQRNIRLSCMLGTFLWDLNLDQD